MKFKTLSAAIAAACGVIAAPAYALTADQYTNTSEFGTGTGNNTMNIRISGATAQDPGLLATAVRVCSPGTMHRYAISNNFVYFCTGGPSITQRPGTTKVAIYKYSVGGSGAGVAPVNNATPLPFLDLTKVAANCTGANATTTTVDPDGAGPLSSYTNVECAGATSLYTTNALSYIGISDVEPSFFGPAAGNYDSLQSEALASVIFGAPVTRNIYEALQRQQGLATLAQQTTANAGGTISPAAACGATNLAGLVSEACMPSLSQAQLTSMYTQSGQSWGALGIDSGLADDTIYVARRADTSGTQKSYEAVVAKTVNGSAGGKSCAEDTEIFVSGTFLLNNAAADAACNAASPADIAFNASGSGQVVRCLEGLNASGHGGIGVLSTEYKQTAAGQLRFTKIGGVAPTHAQVASGAYQYYTDAALNTRLGTSPTASALGYPAFLTLLKNNFANPATVEIINAGDQTFGPSGLMALDALATPVPAADFSGATPRNPWSRLVGGTTLNNCQSGKANF